MTAGGESTKVQLTTGGKAVSSHQHRGRQAETELRPDRDPNARKPLALIAQGRPRAPSHPLDVSAAVKQLQAAAAVSPNTGTCLCSCPMLRDEGLLSPCSSEDARGEGLLQPCAALAPRKSSSFHLSKMTFKYHLKNQYEAQPCCISRAAWHTGSGPGTCCPTSEVLESGEPLPRWPG